MTQIKYSRQRQAIKDYLCNSTEHPTADMIYQHIRKTYPNISLGTVYRNLHFLSEHNEILTLHITHDCERFDGNTKPHYHFLCNKCNSVLDLHMSSIDHIKTIAAYGFDGQIDNFNIFFNGLCPHCKKLTLNT